MPAVIAALIQGLRWLFMSRLGLFLATAMVWLGINLASINLVLEPTIALLTGFAQGAGGAGGPLFATAQEWAGVLQFDKALTMIISAYITKRAITAGRLFVFKRGMGGG